MARCLTRVRYAHQSRLSANGITEDQKSASRRFEKLRWLSMLFLKLRRGVSLKKSITVARRCKWQTPLFSTSEQSGAAPLKGVMLRLPRTTRRQPGPLSFFWGVPRPSRGSFAAACGSKSPPHRQRSARSTAPPRGMKSAGERGWQDDLGHECCLLGLGRELDLAARSPPSTSNSHPAAQGPDRKKVGLASSRG
jgi:hypothetical protein